MLNRYLWLIPLILLFSCDQKETKIDKPGNTRVKYEKTEYGSLLKTDFYSDNYSVMSFTEYFDKEKKNRLVSNYYKNGNLKSEYMFINDKLFNDHIINDSSGNVIRYFYHNYNADTCYDIRYQDGKITSFYRKQPCRVLNVVNKAIYSVPTSMKMENIDSYNSGDSIGFYSPTIPGISNCIQLYLVERFIQGIIAVKPDPPLIQEFYPSEPYNPSWVVLDLENIGDYTFVARYIVEGTAQGKYDHYIDRILVEIHLE